MSGIAALALSTGASLLNEMTEQAGYGLGKLTGYNKSLANDQYNQQRRLSEMQAGFNSGLMKQSYAEQLNLWNQTQAEAQVQHLKNAGLNPALIYGHAGAGGATAGSGGASVGGGSASGESERKASNIQAAGMGLQLAKLQSEIDVNKSVAEANRAQAKKAGADTATTEATRSGIVEQIASTIENIKADTGLKGEETKLNEIQQKSAEIANDFNEANNLTLLQQNMETLRQITAETNVSEQTQNSMIELAKLQVKETASKILLNNSNISLNEADKNLISAKINEIANQISISNKQLTLNEAQLAQALDIEKMNLSSGVITKEVRGLLLSLKNAITGRNSYKW